MTRTVQYRELAHVLKQSIDDGQFRLTGKLPTEDNLMKLYGVTRYCVRNAVAVLQESGDVYPVQGSGMFVRENKREGCLSLGQTRGLSAEFPGKTVQSTVLSLELEPVGDALASRLKCKASDMAYTVQRLRLVDGLPLALERSTYLKRFIPYLSEEIAQGSIWEYLRNDLGLNTGFADKVLYADRLSSAEAEALGLNEGDPCLVVEDDVYLANGEMFDASRVVYHYERAKFFTLADLK